MSKYIDSVHKKHNNIFVLTPLIVEFYKELQSNPKNILLAYLILPLVLHADSRQTLKFVNKTSSIHSYRKYNKNLFGLPYRIECYKEMTDKCLQYALSQKWLEISDDLSVKVLKEQQNEYSNLSDSFKAANNLHKVFKDMDVVAIYRLLGIKKL
ncbi:three component ABC system middle component [Bathymodiolus thermophilus thioautotrophic gill symbiont]|uniref:Uncharacterized protein n=1 Tax=Bathymodiolus thermophilus thioautotrophic gill symbiont TaxID=2360 RepID=A0A8H8XBJ7_9GAMM|nr:three component ABC system middle component [Bathymodiolus thermophilus thioautotrophic gill symbiont]CAB5494949.1 hypothetical protein THERMOS_196 [Bathymodiolus thermophilus thioautotrophic gill symbiont]